MESKDISDETCVLCCRETSIFAVGPCDHPVCYECSSRMRVLCQTNECPICRGIMPIVIFSRKKQFPPYHDFKCFDEEYKIYFENEKIQDSFKKLLENQCQKCDKVFGSFLELEKHVRRDHSLFYCETCANNLKLFTFERRSYDRKELALHNRKGDVDDKSHRGHPSCQFCEQRFMDPDELYRHLRKEHFFCHFCDADGFNEFYEDYEYLRDHFRRQHFLCEEGECAKEHFVGAFRSEIDLKAHKLKHTRNMSKAEVKQARTLDLEFNYHPRRQQNDQSSPNQNDYRRGRNTNAAHRRRTGEDNSIRNEQEEADSLPAKPFTPCVGDFPSLSNEGSENFLSGNVAESRYSSCVTATPSHGQRLVQKKWHDSKNIQQEHFPALSSATPHVMHSTQNGSGIHSKPVAHPQNRQTFSQQVQQKANAQNSKQKESGNSSWAQKKKALSMDDFPKLMATDRSTGNRNFQVSSLEIPSRNVSLKVLDESLVGQQIYKKCKEKSRTTSAIDTKSSSPPTKRSDMNNVNQSHQPLSKMYGGLGKYSVMENQENKDPLKEKIDEIMCRNKANRFKISHEEEVPWSEPAKLVADDFPPLAPAEMVRPPGFGNSLYKSSSSHPPPPGFSKGPELPLSSGASISLSSIAQQLNTGKNNSSSTFLDSDDVNSKQYSYHEPVDFPERNNLLISKIIELIGSNNKLFDEFKSLSGSFRKNKISAAEYHLNCLQILGKDKFLQLFPELLCLLPDIDKQQELLMVHERFLKEDSKTYGAVPKKRQQNTPVFTACPTCSQVLAKGDFANHQISHKNEINSLNT